MTQDATLTNVENGTQKTSKVKKSVDTSKIEDVNRVPNTGVWISSKEASKLLHDMPITSVNNLAYAGKLKAIRISGIFLFDENSVKEHAEHKIKQDAEKKNEQEKAKKENINKLISKLEKQAGELEEADLKDAAAAIRKEVAELKIKTQHHQQVTAN